MYISSFVSIFPVNNPQYVCVISIDSPNKILGKHWGNETAAPITKEIYKRRNKFNKKDFLNVSNKINTLIKNISLKANLNKDEITSLKFLMFKRMGYGFKIVSLFNFLPLSLFKIIFYLASPMYLISLRKFVLVMRHKIRALVSTLKNIKN